MPKRPPGPPPHPDDDPALAAGRMAMLKRAAVDTPGADEPDPPKRRRKSKSGDGAKATPEPPGTSEAPPPAKRGGSRGGGGSGRKKVKVRRRGGGGGWRSWLLALVIGLGLGIGTAGVVLFRDALVTVDAWQSANPPTPPTTIWSGPLTWRRGDPGRLDELVTDLLEAGYAQAASTQKPGQFAVRGDEISVWSPGWAGPGIEVPESRGRVVVEDARITTVEPKAGLRLHPSKLAATGELSHRRSPVTLREVAPTFVPALLAIEDARFRDHPGVDVIGLLRALWHNVRGGDLHGGSTLTQQLAKNLFLGQERTVRRKVKEAFLAAALEARLDKDALLELYLTEVYLGHQDGLPIFGVEQAARAWLGKPASALTAGESALIAGVIASPNLYAPHRDPAAALARRDVVIDRMVYVRALTEAQGDAARAEPLTLAPSHTSASWRSPWAVAGLLQAAGDAGLTGTTDLYGAVQPHLQRATEHAVATSLAATERQHPAVRQAEIAVAVVRASDGAVLAMVGGRDFRASPFHRALSAWREAGSTVKPLVAATALARGLVRSPADLIPDNTRTLHHDGTAWTPRNYDGSTVGEVTLGRALESSRNLPFVYLAEQLGWDRTGRALQRAGLDRATELPSVSLGGFPTTVVQLAGAYTALATDGRARPPRVLLGTTTDGRSQPVSAPDPVLVADRAEAALVRRMMMGVIARGTARSAAAMLDQGDVAGKTGTTDAARDAWFVGFDSEIVVAVWVGPDRGALGLTGAEAALPIWRAVIEALGGPHGRFTAPPELVRRSVCASTLALCDTCAPQQDGWFLRGHEVTRCPVVTTAAAPTPAVVLDAAPVEVPPSPDPTTGKSE